MVKIIKNYDLNVDSIYKHNNEIIFKTNTKNNNIKSDFNLTLRIIYEIFLYFLLLFPRLIGFIFYLFFNPNKSKYLFGKILLEPFKLINLFFNWFFQAKYTAYLSILLIILFFIQIFILEVKLDINLYLYSFYDLLNGNYYSIFTSIFLHGSLYHLFGNLLFLNIFGRIVEKYFGWKVIMIFIASGLISNLVSGFFFYLSKDFTPALGASGGIAGLIILSILLDPFTFTMGLLFPLPVFIVGWLGILNDIRGYLYNSGSNINYMAHLSGYLSLLVLMFFINIKNRTKIYIGLIINLLLLLITYFVMKYFLDQSIISIFL